MDILYPTKHIRKHDFSGKLLIDGDLEDNCILFRFLFDEESMIHPLLIWIKMLPIALLGGDPEKHGEQEAQTFVFELNIPDFSNHIIKTRLLFPDFSLKGHKIEVMEIESQVQCCVSGIT